MSKFHDEFFKAGSPRHDKLMIKCLSPSGIDKLGEAISFDDAKRFDARIHQFDFHRDVFICGPADRRIAHKENVVGVSNQYIHRKEDMPPLGLFDFEDERWRYTRVCAKTDCVSRGRCPWLVNGTKIDQLSAPLEVQTTSRRHEYETEKIVRNGNFIIGYADAVINFTWAVKLKAIIQDGWIWENFEEYEIHQSMLLEAKPQMNSLGDVVRQLKTYSSHLQNPHSYIPNCMVIATYDSPDTDSLDYLAHEGIKVVTFEET